MSKIGKARVIGWGMNCNSQILVRIVSDCKGTEL